MTFSSLLSSLLRCFPFLCERKIYLCFILIMTFSSVLCCVFFLVLILPCISEFTTFLKSFFSLIFSCNINKLTKTFFLVCSGKYCSFDSIYFFRFCIFNLYFIFLSYNCLVIFNNGISFFPCYYNFVHFLYLNQFHSS